MHYEKPTIVTLTSTELENAKIVAMLQEQPVEGEGGGGCQCQCQCQCQAQ